MQCSRQRRLAAAGQPREEHHEALLVGCRPLAVDHSPHASGISPSPVTPRTSPGAYAATTRCPRAWSASASPREASGTATTSARGQELGGHQGGAHSAGADSPQACRSRPAPAAARDRRRRCSLDVAQVLVGERAGDRHGEGGGAVPLGDLGGGQVQPPEGAELVVAQRADRAGDADGVARVVRRLDVDAGQGEPLGVDELQPARVRGRCCDVGRDLQRDQAASALEPAEPERAVREELEVVELARSRAVLRERAGHRVIVPHPVSTRLDHPDG